MPQDTRLLSLFYRVAHTISSSLDLDTTLQSILTTLHEALGLEAATIRLVNPDASGLDLVASIGDYTHVLEGLSATLSPGSLYGRVMAGETVHEHTQDAGHDSGLLAIPMQVRGRVTGALTLLCTAPCQLDDTMLTLLQGVADLAAIAIENARLHTSLFRIATAMTSSLELQPMLTQVLEATVLEMGLKAASVRLLDETGKHLGLVAAYGLSQSYPAKGTVEVSRSPIDQRVLDGQPATVFDVGEDPGFQYRAEAAREGIESVLAVPLRVKERIVGVMRVYSARPRPFTPVGIAFLQSVAGMVGVAIENARLYEALQARYEGLKTDVSEWYRFLTLG